MPAFGAVLRGYGDVAGCYKYPDKSIPTCDGAAYVNVYDWENYCYIPSLGCNMLVVVEGVASYDKPDEYAKLYETVVPIDIDKYDRVTATYIYCRMTYPYVGYYVAQADYPGAMPADEVMACGGLFYDESSYNCYQNPADADEWCDDNYWIPAFWNEEEKDLFLSALFATEIVSERPCDIGISRLMVSTGGIFQLYAEKYTEPSLVVSYNDQKCYGKLEQGSATGAINVKYNGAVYHTVE
ncbi:MAG: hypothetical protein R8M37_02810 [Alphaproteobacteria bacterium]|nr:hypothetical protein [Alphaproteobacteria bacterium]